MNVNQPNPIDSSALDSLFRRYWGPTGWINGDVSAAEFLHAKAAGVMFDPMDITHDEVIARVLAIRDRLSPDTVADAFLSSFASRRLDLRSALGSYGAILRLVPHAYARVSGRIDCGVCGAYLNSFCKDISVFNFERFKWGGVRHVQPLYAALDLEWLSSTGVTNSNKQGLDTLRRMIEKIGNLGPGAGPSDAESALKGLFPSNKTERRVVIDILGLAGVLAPEGLPTFFGAYPDCAERKQPVNKNDWSYPVLWWKGSDGINDEALRFWFPNL